MASKEIKHSLVFVLVILMVFFISSCTKMETMELTITEEKIIEDISSITQSNEKETANKSAATPEIPMVITEQPKIVVDPGAIKEGLCTEKVLLGLRSCEKLGDGDLNITIKNSGYKNVTMIFYLLLNDKKAGYVYYDENFATKTEKTYNINLRELEEQYGRIDKIQATPILIEGLSATACANKKLPIIVSGCKTGIFK
ncbi:MAG: hypothetical protein N3D84_01380 [Candidatus Woesearchaeota archaeon]|nr:hypothetical protein [Candidatus Woesearchaeota archaeon]